MLTVYGKLSIAIIVYYVLALPVAIMVCMRQGFGRHGGWLYLLSLAIVRIVAGALRLAADDHPSTGIYIATSIFFSIGLVPLILALNGMVKRINDGLEFSHLPPRIFQFTHIITIIGLALGIAAGSQSGSSKASTQSTVSAERKAGAVLLLVAGVLNSLMVLSFAARLRRVFSGDRMLVFCGAASTPFLLVRLVYTMLLAFDSSNAKFNFRNPDIYVESFMMILMEMICFALYSTAGLFAPKVTADDHQYGRGSELMPGKRSGAYARNRSEAVPVSERV